MVELLRFAVENIYNFLVFLITLGFIYNIAVEFAESFKPVNKTYITTNPKVDEKS